MPLGDPIDVKIKGYHSSLRREEVARITLAMTRVDQPYTLQSVRADRQTQTRLAAIGLYPGVELTVISRSLQGPCIVIVKDSRLVLDRQMAHQIMIG